MVGKGWEEAGTVLEQELSCDVSEQLNAST